LPCAENGQLPGLVPIGPDAFNLFRNDGSALARSHCGFGGTVRSVPIDAGCSEVFVIDTQPEKPASTPDEFTVLPQHELTASEVARLRLQILQTRAELKELHRAEAMRARREQQLRDAAPLIPPSEGEEKT